METGTLKGRVHPQVKANYLASPVLVVAYALAGTMDINLIDDPIGQDQSGEDVFLRDIWPSQNDIADTIATSLTPEMFKEQYDVVAGAPYRMARIINFHWGKFQMGS